MTSLPEHEVRINDFARRAFRDIGDMDYIAARLALRHGLIPQFLWSSLQAFEKYFKYVLLVNRQPSIGLGHDIDTALSRVRADVPYADDLHPDKHAVFRQIAEYGADRYLIGSWAAHGTLLSQLDASIWDVRRYCQVLTAPPAATPDEQRIYQLMRETVKKCRNAPHAFRIKNGFLEQVFANKHHPAHAALCWKNAHFGNRARRTMTERFYLHASNAPLALYPDMIDDLAKLITIPKSMRLEYEATRDAAAVAAASVP
jgi:hypothetical protein